MAKPYSPELTPPVDTITHLITQYRAAGLFVLRLPQQQGRPSKAPTFKGWNLPLSPTNPHGYTKDLDQAERWLCDGDNLGLALVPSRIVALDIDDLEETLGIFDELDLPLRDWLKDDHRVEIQSGRPGRAKILFRLDGEAPAASRKLIFGKAESQRTVFEIRHGSVEGRKLQDVLPPSVNPVSGRPYELVGDISAPPVIPPELLALWKVWPNTLRTFDPDFVLPEETLRKSYEPVPGERDAICEFNDSHDLEALLISYGYQRKGRNRFLRPGSTSRIPGVQVFERDGRKLCISFGGDNLNDSRAHDSFDVHRLLGCRGDWKQALNWNPELTEHNQRVRREACDREAFAAKAGTAPENPRLSDPHVALPIPEWDVMLYGLVGDVGRVAAIDTEVNSIAAAAGFLSFVSANLGRDIFLPIGNTRHHARLFTLHVGRSSKGRKGDGLALTYRIREYLETRDLPENTLAKVHDGGLSSREGLVWLIHDGVKQGKVDIAPIEDKRLWIVESEFSNVLHQAKRNGNTLSGAVRDSWDGKSIKPATKSDQAWTTYPHIALTCHITPSELLDLIENRDLTNGFANRFLIFWAERDRLVPRPLPTPENVVKDLAERTFQVIDFARGTYPATKDSREMILTEAANEAYETLYLQELNQPEDSDTVAAILDRRAPMLLRLAMLFALTDRSLEIDVPHINAAAAWIRYCAASVRFVFAKLAAEDDSSEARENADKIVVFLKKNREADRSTLHTSLFKGHLSAAKLDAAITVLLTESPARVELIPLPRADGKPGKGRKLYRLKAGSEIGENRTVVGR